MMEKESSTTDSPVLPFLYELKQRRQRSPCYAYIIFAVEVFFVAIFPFNHSQPVADAPMATAVQIYKGVVLTNPITIQVVNALFFLLPLLLLLTVSTLYLQRHLPSADRYRDRFQKLKRIQMTAIIALEVVVLPGFLMAAQNIVEGVTPGIRAICFINLPFAGGLVFLDRKRRLFQGYSIFMLMVRLLLPFDWGPLAMSAISFWLGSKELATNKRVVYYLFGIWSTLITTSYILNAQINSFQLLLALAATAALTVLSPHPAQPRTALEENQKLMQLVERMQDGRELTLCERMAVSRAVFSFREELQSAEEHHLNEREREWLAGENGVGRQALAEFIATKIAFELRRQYSHSLKMQQLQCDVRLARVGMRTLYELESLILQIRTQSSFAEREQLHRLVALTDLRFLSKEQNANANATIARERQVERLYELFINIAITMQEFWTLHRGGRLGSRLMERILRRVTEMQGEAERILRRVGRCGSIKHELVIFEFLRKLVNNSHRTGEWRESETEKEESLGSDNCNYILIEQGNILAMSNRLLNEFELSRKEAEGYRLTDIVNEQTSQYLAQRLDRLIEEQSKEGSSFILPLKVSRERAYIQPYRTEVQILPELMNGIKYILHLQKPTELQRTPCLLYCGNTDTVIGITRNFAAYFGLSHDHYLFHDFTHELFNADLLALAQPPAKDGSEIICEFRAKRMTTRFEGRSLVAKVPVVLKKLKQYEVGEQTLVLLSIIKREELERTQMTNLMSEKIVFVEEGRESREGWREGRGRAAREGAEKQKQDLEGRTFCKISNPYENLIDEKISKMEQFYRMSYLKGLALVIAGILLALLCSLVVLPIKLTATSDGLMQDYSIRIVDNDKAIHTLQLYTQSAILYQLYQYPQEILKVNPNYNITALVDEYAAKVSLDIEDVLEDTIDYEISGRTTTKSISIYDILVNAKLSIATRNITALIATWPSITNFTAIGEASRLSGDSVGSFFLYFTWLTALAVFLLVLAAEGLSFKTEQVFEEILHLYERIDDNHSQQFVQKYRLFAHELYSSSYFRGVRAHDYLRRYKDKKKLAEIDEMSTLMYLEKTVGVDLQQEQTVSDPVPTAASTGEVKIERRFFLAFLWRESYILLLLFFFMGFMQIFLYKLNTFSHNFSLVLDHSVLLHEARGNISFNAASFMTSALQEVLPPAQRIPPFAANQMYLNSELDSQLPSYFQAYDDNLTAVLYSDLCAMGLNTNTLYVKIPCGSVLGGIMQQGIPQTMVFYNDLVNRYSFTPMSAFASTFRPKATFPVFLEVLYVRRALYNLLTSFEQDFMTRTQDYIQQQTGTLGTIVKLGWILLPIFLVLLVTLYLGMSRKCGIALKSFFILPKEYLLEMKVTKVLRQRDILNRIEKLAF